SIRFTTPMLFAIAMVATFTIGGVSGVMHATSPHNLQQTDTYFVVAHFHYVLIGGLINAIFAAIFYWWPKFTGRMLSERLGKIFFWLSFTGFNLTFMPQHWIGLLGMPRRIFTYSAELGLDTWNLISSIGGFIQAAGILVLITAIVKSLRSKERAERNPWGAATLEWATEAPPVPHKFQRTPVVHRRQTPRVEREQVEAK